MYNSAGDGGAMTVNTTITVPESCVNEMPLHSAEEYVNTALRKFIELERHVIEENVEATG